MTSSFTDIPEEHRELLVGLPYRVGVWMSEADDVEGEGDDEKEQGALERMITGLARAKDISPFVQEVAQQTLSNKIHWPEWAEQSFDILGDCEKAVGILTSHASKQEQKSYKNMLMKIASVVAGAHGEFAGLGEEEEGGLFGKIGRMFHGKQDPEDKFMNISPAEEAALERLGTALRLKEKDDE